MRIIERFTKSCWQCGMPQPRFLKTPPSPISSPRVRIAKALARSRLPTPARRKPPERESPQWLSSSCFSARLDGQVADHFFQPDVTVLHAFFHAARKHHGAGLFIRQRHAHCHQGADAIWSKCGFNVILRSGIGQKHAFHVHDLAVRFDFDEFAGDVESAFSWVLPFVAELSSRLCIVDTDRHGPAFWAEHPLLDDL